MWQQGDSVEIFLVKRERKAKLPFPPSPPFSKEVCSCSSHGCSFPWLPARTHPDGVQHVPGARRGYFDPAYQPEHHTGTALMEVDRSSSASSTQDEISISIVLIKSPVALNPGSS